jgi:hypothetical protein
MTRYAWLAAAFVALLPLGAQTVPAPAAQHYVVIDTDAGPDDLMAIACGLMMIGESSPNS